MNLPSAGTPIIKHARTRDTHAREDGVGFRLLSPAACSAIEFAKESTTHCHRTRCNRLFLRSPSSSSPPTAIGLAEIVCSSVSAIEFSGGIRIYLCRLGLHLFGSSWFR
ncbi:hypothetical protein L1887_09099 [Cichorium endivia]|nr:hypothetical protein L1887_09099 [Cichorium endivia]